MQTKLDELQKKYDEDIKSANEKYEAREYEDTTSKVESHDDRLSYADTVKNYNKQQKANYYARQVRSKKNDIASGDNSKDAKVKLGLAQKKYREYCKQNDLEVDYFKTWRVGYNK